MSPILVIVESPAKCNKIESYLGPGYKVIASFGHLRTITGLESVDIANNYNVTFTIIDDKLKAKQIEKLRSEIAVAKDVILATDDDREGEAIAWHICDLYGLSVAHTKRIIFHEITETAIQSAIAHPKRINMSLVNAQKSRQILDLLVGYNVSPILWNCITRTHSTSLSAGRCQTPALRLIYDNYLEINSAPGLLVYNTVGYFTNLTLNFELNKQFTVKEDVLLFLEKCKEFQFKYTVTAPKKVIKKTHEPLTTSTLQQLASNELHFSPKETMSYAQQLYEHGYITYMRTDSKKYSNEFIDKMKIYIQKNYGEQYISQTIDLLATIKEGKEGKEKPVKTTIAEKKGIPAPQEAHEAIRPVNIDITNIKGKEPVEKACRLYELIWKRTVESCMPSAQYNSISAKISAPIDTEFVYKAEQPVFLGWQIVEKTLSNKKKEETNLFQYLTTLKQNSVVKPKKIESKFSLTQLKTHYSEARLVQLLEEKGIGRPSTFASLIDKIQERKYALKQNITGKTIENTDFAMSDNIVTETISTREYGNEHNKLVIQPLGVIVIEFLINHFDNFFNYDYTKQMEDELDRIANDESSLTHLCGQCNDKLKAILCELQHLKPFKLEIDRDHTLIIAKHGPVVKYVNPSNTKEVSFIPVRKDLDLEKLKHIPELSLEDVVDKEKNAHQLPIGKYQGLELFIKKGKYGLYAQWGKESRSLKEAFTEATIEYTEVIRYLDKDTVLDPSKPVGFVRELNQHLSIRSGKYGDYILYKKPRAKKPEFLKLNGFTNDYKKCDKSLILNWIKQTYNAE